MIGFHEIRFPEDVSWGSRGGPVYKTQIFSTHRGFEKRNVDWSQPMMQFNAAYGVKTDVQIMNLLNFFNARQGKLFGFRYKNWTNYQVREDAVAAGDGYSKRLPLYKFYGSGSTGRHYKRLKKIVRGSVKNVTVIGQPPMVEGTDYRIDYDSGEIVLNDVVGYGMPVRVQNLEFDEPVRFEDDSVENVIEAYNNNALSTLNLVSVRGNFSAGSAFSPDESESGDPDPHYGRTFLLLNFDSTEDPTTTLDRSIIQNPMTLHNSAQISKDVFRHGNGALVSGPNGWASTIGAPYNFQRQPFSIELFAQQPVDGELKQKIIGLGDSTASDKSFLLRYSLDTKRLEFLVSSNGEDFQVVLSHPWESSPGFFDYISVDRMASGWYVLRINGEVRSRAQDKASISVSSSPLTIAGGPSMASGEGPFQAHIDSVRITAGYARNFGFDKVETPKPYGVTQ